VKRAKQQEAIMSKLLFYSPDKDFRAGHHVPLAPYRRGVNDGTPFLDPWNNPYLTRGVPPSEAELRQANKPFKTFPEVPYVTAVGGNKSHILPNNIFDVIHDAEWTGGVVYRYKCCTKRYGVPDHCDDRSPQELLIPPPPKPRPKTEDPIVIAIEQYNEGITAAAKLESQQVENIDQAIMGGGGPPTAF